MMKDSMLYEDIRNAVDNVTECGYMDDKTAKSVDSDFLNEADFNAFLTASMPEYYNGRFRGHGFTFIIPRYMWTFKE